MKRLFILTGLLLLTGALFNRTIAQNRENQVREQSIKYQRLMAYIDAFYVDTVNLQKLTEDAIIKALSDLDPHSVYITKEEVDEMNEPLEGGAESPPDRFAYVDIYGGYRRTKASLPVELLIMK